MNKFFRCTGLTKEQAIQAARDWAEREGVIYSIEYSMDNHYLDSDIIIIGRKFLTHSCDIDLDVNIMQEVPALKPLTLDKANSLIRDIHEDCELHDDCHLWVEQTDLTIDELEQILQIMRRIEK